ncbi:hypothetical protein ACWIFB_10845 [Dietzia sp. NPDC055340]
MSEKPSDVPDEPEMADHTSVSYSSVDDAEQSAPGQHAQSHAARHRARPEWLSVVIEFFTMSRSTLVLLVAFVLIAALYSFVRQDPVVAINSPPRPAPTQSETTQSETTRTDATETADPSPTDQSTEPTATTDAAETSGTGTPQTSVPRDSRLVEPGQGTGAQGTDGQQPQQSAPGVTQAPQGQQPQQPQLPQPQTQVPAQ